MILLLVSEFEYGQFGLDFGKTIYYWIVERVTF